MIKLTITTKAGTAVTIEIPDDAPLEQVSDWLKGVPEPNPLEQKLAEQVVEEEIRVESVQVEQPQEPAPEPERAPSPYNLDHTIETPLDAFQFPCQHGVWTPGPQLVRDFILAFGEEHCTKEFLKARSWLLTNPIKRKTTKGMGRFLNAWLCREAGMQRVSVKEVVKTKTGSLLDEGVTDPATGW